MVTHRRVRTQTRGIIRRFSIIGLCRALWHNFRKQKFAEFGSCLKDRKEKEESHFVELFLFLVTHRRVRTQTRGVIRRFSIVGLCRALWHNFRKRKFAEFGSRLINRKEKPRTRRGKNMLDINYFLKRMHNHQILFPSPRSIFRILSFISDSSSHF